MASSANKRLRGNTKDSADTEEKKSRFDVKIIGEIEDLDPANILVSHMLQIFDRTTCKLALLLLAAKIEDASCGWSLEATADVLTELSEEPVRGKLLEKPSDMPVRELVDNLRKFSNGSLVNVNNIVPKASQIAHCLRSLHVLQANACGDMGPDGLPIEKMVRLAYECGLMDRLGLKKTRVVDALDLIEAVHGCRTLRGTVANDLEVLDRWEAWLKNHRGVMAYLDPHYVLVVPAGAAVAGLGAILATFPVLPGGAPVPAVDAVGNNVPCLFSVGSAADRQSIAAMFRSNLAHPAPPVGMAAVAGGGAGPATTIFHFATTALAQAI